MLNTLGAAFVRRVGDHQKEWERISLGGENEFADYGAFSAAMKFKRRNILIKKLAHFIHSFFRTLYS